MPNILYCIGFYSLIVSTIALSITNPMTMTNNAVIIPDEYVKIDTYDGVNIVVSDLPIAREISTCNCSETKAKFVDDFVCAFRLKVEEWKVEKRKGIWVTLSTELSMLVPYLTGDMEFDFQFAEKGSVVLTRWLPASESRLPLGPSHQVGVGCLLIHPYEKKMLCVQEKTGPAAKRKLWKMPTGLTDPGEDIADAAIREMKEETGLDCIFDHIICFRQAHGGLFNKSDMFFVCLLRLDDYYDDILQSRGQIEMNPQVSEIADIQWLDMEYYMNQNTWVDSPLYRRMNEAMLDAAKAEGLIEISNDTETKVSNTPSHSKICPYKLDVGFRPGSNTLYISSASKL